MAMVMDTVMMLMLYFFFIEPDQKDPSFLVIYIISVWFDAFIT